MVIVEEVKTTTRKLNEKKPKAKKANKSKSVTTVTQVAVVPKNTNNRRVRGRGKASLKSAMIESILYPDLAGPTRFPIPGNDARTVPGQEKSRVILLGSATNTVQVALLHNLVYPSDQSVAYTYTQTTTGGVLTTPTVVSGGPKFPGVLQIHDARLVSGCLVVQYTGNLMNAAGELIIGTVPDNGTNPLNGSSYNTLSYLPGVQRIPIASLVNSPLRVALRHCSPQSWDLAQIDAAIQDLQLPFVACSQLPAGLTLSIDFVKNYEVRSTVANNYGLPYSSSSNGRASDEAAMADAMDEVGKMPNTVTSLFPGKGSSMRSMINGLFTSAAPYMLEGAQLASGIVLETARQYVHDRVRQGGQFYAHNLIQ